MSRVRRAVIGLAVITTAVACGGSSSGGSAVPMTQLTVDAVAKSVGIGCTYDTLLVAGDQLVVKDDIGRTLGVAKFRNAKPRGCHWVTTVGLPDREGFYALASNGHDLGTVHRTATGSSWAVEVSIDYPLHASLRVGSGS